MDKKGIQSQSELYRAQSQAHEAVLASKKRAKETAATVADEDVPTTGAELVSDLLGRLEKIMESGHAMVVHHSDSNVSVWVDTATVDITHSTDGQRPSFSLGLEHRRGDRVLDSVNLGHIYEERRNFFLESYKPDFARQQLAQMFEYAENVGVIEEACGIEQPFTAEGFLGQLAVGDQAGA